MIYLRRSGSELTLGTTDADHIQDVACRALDRGETVELQIDHTPWEQATSADEVRDIIDDLCDELDARRAALEDQEQLPLDGDAL